MKFDYALVPSASRSKVQLATQGIRNAMDNVGANILEIGRRLLEVKDELPHGQFLPWLQKEFSMTASTANRYMMAASKSLTSRSAFLQLESHEELSISNEKAKQNQANGESNHAGCVISESEYSPKKAPIRPVPPPPEPIKMRAVPDEEVKPAQPVKKGGILPDATAIDEAVQLLKELMAAVHAICGQPPDKIGMKCGHYLRTELQDLENHVKELRRAFRFGRPYSVCPHCAGKEKRCEGCKGVRWVTEQMYEAAAPEFQEQVKGTVIK